MCTLPSVIETALSNVVSQTIGTASYPLAVQSNRKARQTSKGVNIINQHQRFI